MSVPRAVVGIGVLLAVRAAGVRADVPINFVSQWGGPTAAVTVEGNLAYIGLGHRVVILDVTDPATPTVVGRTDPLDGFVEGLAVSGSYVYVAGSEAGLLVIDVSDPASPVRVAELSLPSGIAYGVAIAGDYAYVASADPGLEIVNISEPLNPAWEATYDTGGQCVGVVVDGTHAYVADGFAGLTVVDVSAPAAPTLAGSLALPDYASGVAVAGTYAYLADAGAGLQVVDISDPTDPQPAGNCGTDAVAFGVAVVGNYAYVANAWAGLAIIDISTPSTPAKVGNAPAEGWSTGVAVAGGHAYLASEAYGLHIIDVSVPPDATWVAQYRGGSGEVTDLAASGNHLYIADGAGGTQVLDVTDPAAPVRLGGVATHEFAWGMTLSGSFVFLADGCAGLGVVDVTDPVTPVRRGEAPTDCAARDVVVQGDYAYVARDGGHGLTIVNISDPDLPTVAGHWEDSPISGYALGVAVSGHLAYLADADQGLQIIDVSDSANPVRLARFDTGGTARDVALGGRYAYVADEWLGLIVVDVSDSANPSFAGRCDAFGNGQGVTLAGRYAFVAAGRDGLQMVDITDPANPVRVGQYDTPGFVRRVAVAGNRVYVADYDDGVVVLDAPVGDYFWNNPLGGDFATPGNWTPAGPPGLSDRAVFNVASGYTTTMPADTDVANDRLLVNDGDVQLDLSGRTYTLQHAWDGSPSVAVGDDATRATSARLGLYNGGIVAKELELGRWSDNEAFLDMWGISWDASGSFFDIGVYGRGTLAVDGGTASHQHGWLAFQPDSVGVLTVSDSGQWNVSDDMVVGRAGGGTLTVESGAASQVGRCILGELTQGVGRATVQADGALNILGNSETSFIVGKGGQGTLTVRGGGQVQNAGMTHVAEENGSVGHVELRNIDGSGGQMTSHYQMVVGLSGGEGTVDVDGAGSQLSVLGGDPGNPDDIVSLELGRWDGHGVMNVTGGGHVSVPYGGAPNTGSVCVGGSGPGELTVDGPGSVFDNQFWMDVGRDAPGQLMVRNGGHVLISGQSPSGGYIWIGSRASGDVTVTGADSQLIAGAQMTVSDTQKGTLMISDHGTVQCGTLLIGGYNNPATDGEVTVTGAGSSLTTDLCRIANQGPGWIQITAGASLTTNSQAQVGYQGRGELDVMGGSRAVSHKGASPTGTSGIIAYQSGSTGVVAVSGSSSSWTQDGVLNVGWFGSGTLSVTSGGGVESVSGAAARMGGSTGTVEVTGLNSKWVVSDSLSVGGLMDATGGTASLSVTDQGLITIGKALRVWAGGSVNLSAGRAVVGTGAVPVGEGVLALYSGGTLSGTGTLTAHVDNSGGTVEPGVSPGTLQINGNYYQSGGGGLNIEIGGTGAGQSDKLVVNGVAAVGGTLAVQLVNGFVPHVGDTFEILHATACDGAFVQVNGQAIPGGLRFLPLYAAQNVVLSVALPSPADFDKDGDVDADDLAQFHACARGADVPYGSGCDIADFDGDGDVDMNDFGWFQRCYSGSNRPADPNCAN